MAAFLATTAGALAPSEHPLRWSIHSDKAVVSKRNFSNSFAPREADRPGICSPNVPTDECASADLANGSADESLSLDADVEIISVESLNPEELSLPKLWQDNVSVSEHEVGRPDILLLQAEKLARGDAPLVTCVTLLVSHRPSAEEERRRWCDDNATDLFENILLTGTARLSEERG